MSQEPNQQTAPETEKSESRGVEAPQAAPEGVKRNRRSYQIDIFRDWCKSCGICAAFCPKQCIALDEDGAPIAERSAECSGCGWCEIHCPDFAISVREVKEKKAQPDREERED